VEIVPCELAIASRCVALRHREAHFCSGATRLKLHIAPSMGLMAKDRESGRPPRGSA
jgi:hypothetical protein